jgi:hypothetical protein
MVALDANEDGELSAEEIENAVAALKKLDKDDDGKLSREELRPEFGPGGPGMFGGPGPGGPGQQGPGGPGRGGRGGGGMVERIMGFDANEDGKVSKAELPEQMQQRMFPRADANGDGAIDREEAQAVAERFQQRGGGRGEGGGRGGRGEGRRGGGREGGAQDGGGQRPDRPRRPQGPGSQ